METTHAPETSLVTREKRRYLQKGLALVPALLVFLFITYFIPQHVLRTHW